MKRWLVVFMFIMFSSQVYSAPQGNSEHAGTPPGFYDDIDPASVENNDEPDDSRLPFRYINPENDIQQQKDAPYQTYSESNDFFVPTADVPATKNYSQIYNSLEPADFSYLHNIDPDQYYDMKDTTWSTYPLLRLTSQIYFKSLAIEPGYYLLTPREHNGKWYMLFKQNGLVVHIIPVYDRDYTPEKFYNEHIPKPKLTPSQKVHMKFLSAVGKVNSSKRKEPVKSYLEVNDLDNYFVSVIIYYGNHKYSTIFRTIRL